MCEFKNLVTTHPVGLLTLYLKAISFFALALSLSVSDQQHTYTQAHEIVFKNPDTQPCSTVRS